ncbi:MAG: NAD(P)-binding protein [Planctomycetota bacterium]
MDRQAKKRIELTVDGRAVRVPEGSTLLDAARALGIEIPTLCYNQALSPYGSCWICVVKVADGPRSLVPACSTRAAPGMKVTTLDEEIRATRKLCLELILSDHTGDCLAPCRMTCPAGIDVQGYIAHVARGEYEEALRLIKEKNPLPLICGRVCPHPCEAKCRRNLVDEPVAVNAIKRFLADRNRAAGRPYVPPRAERTGWRVAVVGGGPAGLTCAYFLARRGHEVTVFEALPRLGGMLRWGIPAYRLPREALDAEIGSILELGVEVRLNSRLGRDFTLESLQEEGFRAVFLGLGAAESRRMGVEGEDLDGVLSGTEFLRDFELGKAFDFSGKNVAVIGGGNTAIDAARTSLRLRAASVTVLYRRSRVEMPAQDSEVEDAAAEGVRFHFLAAPTRLMGPGRLETIEFLRMELGAPDASGRRRPVPVKGSEAVLPLEVCIAAIGQAPDLASVMDTPLKKTDWGALEVNPKSLATNLDGVFAGGDCVIGAATVVEAVGQGREAAVSIDRYLGGQPVEKREPVFTVARGDWKDLDPADFEHFLKSPRRAVPCLPLAERLGFAEVEQGLKEEAARAEAERCLECGCASVYDCAVRRLAAEYGCDPARFGGEKRKELPLDTHPLIRFEVEKCIMCGACVRVCDEVRDVRALGFVGRGFAARIRPAFGDSLLSAGCISCGACVDLCPSGALVERLGKEGGPFAPADFPSRCTGCGAGCDFEWRTVAGRAVAIGPRRETAGPGPSAFCLRGRFGHRAWTKERRILEPRVRKSGRLEPATYEEAFRAAARVLRGAAGTSAVLVSPHATFEEMLAARAIAEAVEASVVGSLDARSEAPALAGLVRSLGEPFSPRAVPDLLAADLILLVECDPQRSHPSAGVHALAARRMGASLLVLAASPTALDPHAALRLRPATRTAPAVVAGLLARCLEIRRKGTLSKDLAAALRAALREATPAAVERASGIAPAELEEAARRLAEAKNPLVVIDASRAGERLAAFSALLAAALAGESGEAPLLALRRSSNSHGLSRLGLGAVDPEALHRGSAVLAIREDPVAAAGRADLALVVADAVWSESALRAEVVLPIPAPHEAAGRLYATGGREERVGEGILPLAGIEARETLKKLAAACGGAVRIEEPPPRPAIRVGAEGAGAPLLPEPLAGAIPVADSYTRLFNAWAEGLGLLAD